MSRSIRQQYPESECMADRARSRMKAAGIPELPGRRTPEQWELSHKILKEEEDLYVARHQARSKGWPSSRDEFLGAIKDFLEAHDGLIEPTHVVAPPCVLLLFQSWSHYELPAGACVPAEEGTTIKEGDVFCNMTVVLGDEFKLEDRSRRGEDSAESRRLPH